MPREAELLRLVSDAGVVSCRYCDAFTDGGAWTLMDASSTLSPRIDGVLRLDSEPTFLDFRAATSTVSSVGEGELG